MRITFILCVLALPYLVHGYYNNTESWIKDFYPILQNHTLLDISLPGTHDSGAYYFTNEIAQVILHHKDYTDIVNTISDYFLQVDRIVIPLALTQTYSILEQLRHGARYLDLRVYWDGSGWYIHHTMKGHDIFTILDQILTFLDENRYEIVVVDISHIRGYSRPSLNMTMLFDILESTCSTYLIPRSTPLDYTPISDYIETNKRLLINIDDYDEVMNRENFFYYWYTIEGSYAEANVLDQMIDYNNKQIDTLGGHSVFFQTSFTLTPSMTDNILTLFPCNEYQGLLDYTSQTGGDVIQSWFDQNPNKHPGNIVLVDNLEYVDVVTPLLQRIERNCYDNYDYIRREPDRSDCRSRMEDGHCNISSRYYEFMTINCRLSCLFC